jgi:hypothetical protein
MVNERTQKKVKIVSKKGAWAWVGLVGGAIGDDGNEWRGSVCHFVRGSNFT